MGRILAGEAFAVGHLYFRAIHSHMLPSEITSTSSSLSVTYVTSRLFFFIFKVFGRAGCEETTSPVGFSVTLGSWNAFCGVWPCLESLV